MEQIIIVCCVLSKHENDSPHEIWLSVKVLLIHAFAHSVLCLGWTRNTVTILVSLRLKLYDSLARNQPLCHLLLLCYSWRVAGIPKAEC